MELLDNVYWGNSARSYLVAAGVVLAILIGVRLTKFVLLKRIKKLAQRTTTNLDDIFIEVLEGTRMFLALVVAVYVGLLGLVVPLSLSHYAQILAVLAILSQVGLWLGGGISGVIQSMKNKKAAAGDTAGLGAMTMLSLFGRIMVWAVVALLMMDNLGIDVSALVASLGIGGIAVALAVQNVLKDVFASVSILLDRPFEIGDFIAVGDMVGNVQHIGIKTTRLLSLSGEQLVFANGDLLDSRIRNYKRMQERRVLFTVGVTYSTPTDVLEKLPGILREAIEKQDKTRFDRAHFKAFGASSLDFEIVYFMLVPDYTLMMDTQQAINLEIARQFENLKVEIAFPTRTIYLARDAGDPDSGKDDEDKPRAKNKAKDKDKDKAA